MHTLQTNKKSKSDFEISICDINDSLESGWTLVGCGTSLFVGYSTLTFKIECNMDYKPASSLE